MLTTSNRNSCDAQRRMNLSRFPSRRCTFLFNFSQDNDSCCCFAYHAATVLHFETALSLSPLP